MDRLTLYSHAKLNLYLAVLNKRRDHYHNIQTLFERINLCDKIILTLRPDKKIKIICKNPQVPSDNSNLCYRAAKLLQDNFRIASGLDIQIEKCIPVASGLGGGSSNAASLLLGLNKLWRLGLSQARLLSFAQQIGSDVAFFIYNIPFAQASLRGNRVKPLKKIKDLYLWHILVVPKIRVSTPLIYENWDKLHQEEKLTRAESDVKIIISLLKKNALPSLARFLFNSLEEITLSLYPEVKQVKERLADLGLKTILMSGSGPAVFAIVSSRKEACKLSGKLQQGHNLWRVFMVRTF